MLNVLLNNVCMYWFIGLGVENSIDIMVEATAVNTIESPA